MTKKLSELEIGQKGRIVYLSDKNRIYHKLREMGFTKNTPVEVVRKALFGDPIEIQIKQCYISLQKKEAQEINIEI
jgi:ferrous iron transport protein A